MSTETATPVGDADVLAATEQAVNVYLANDLDEADLREQLRTLWPALADRLDRLAGIYETVAISRDPEMVAAIAEARAEMESR